MSTKVRDADDPSQDTVKAIPRKDCLTGNAIEYPDLPSGVYAIEAYKTATMEIRDRINQEQILFALKFTIVGGILLALFSMSKSDQFESFIQRRRTAVFFSAALLTSSVIDIRLRFDIQMVEALGKWIRLVEANLHNTGLLRYPPWETFLQNEMYGLGMPIMRSFSLSLTALLYLVTVYTFVILPRGGYEGTRRIFRACALVMFALLAFLGASYEKRSWHIAIIIASIGFAALSIALGLKKRRSGILRVIGPLLERLEYAQQESANAAAPAEEMVRGIATAKATAELAKTAAKLARERGGRQAIEAAEAEVILAWQKHDRLAKQLKTEREAQEFVTRARRYANWVSRLREPRTYLCKILGDVPASITIERADLKEKIYARLREASVPEANIPAIWDTLVKAQERAGNCKLSAIVKSYTTWFVWKLLRSDWSTLQRLLSEDVDEVESAEDYLWKVYFDIQLALRTGGLRRWPLTIVIPADNTEKVSIHHPVIGVSPAG
jgi:hypothetical protein